MRNLQNAWMREDKCGEFIRWANPTDRRQVPVGRYQPVQSGLVALANHLQMAMHVPCARYKGYMRGNGDADGG